MISKVALLGTILLASLALAVHTSQPGVSLDHRDDNLQSNIEADEDEINWTLGLAGSILTGENFNSITATFTVPALTGSDGIALISMGIDPAGCETGSLSIVIQGNISSNVASWSVWCQWLPAPRIDLNGTMKAGDVITVTVIATSPTTGAVFWENNNINVNNLYRFNTTYWNYLCMRTVGWGVQALRHTRDTFFPFAKFDNVTFTDAMVTAAGLYDTYRPFGPPLYRLYGLSQNKVHLTSISGSGTTLIVRHV